MRYSLNHKRWKFGKVLARGGRAIALGLGIAAAAASNSHAATRSWNAGSGNWATANNWSPASVPAPADDVRIGNLAAAENAFVTLNQDDTIASLEITDGMLLRTDGHTLLVNGDATISGENHSGNVVWPSRLVVDESGNSDDFDVNNLTVQNDGEIDLRNGILEIDNVLSITSSSAIRGEGVVDFGGNEVRVFRLDGMLQAGVEGMTLNQNGAGRLDLDGIFGDSRIHVATSRIDGTAHAWLEVNGDALADDFSGTMTIGSDNIVEMNLSEGWRADAQSSIAFVGSTNEMAVLRGSPATLAGEVRVYDGRIDSDVTFSSTSNVELIGIAELRLNGETVFDGASIEEVDSAFGNREPTVTQNGNLSVTADTVLNIPSGVFDWDGNAANTVTSVEPGVSFTINASAIDNDPDAADPYEALTLVKAGATLTVNTDDAWTNGGEVDLKDATLAGSGVVNEGTIEGSGRIETASLVNNGMIRAQDGDVLVIETAGTTNLDGTNETGELQAVFGDITVAGVPFTFPFDGKIVVGNGRKFLMDQSGIRNQGEVVMMGGEYEGDEFHQAGLLSISNATARIDADSEFQPGSTTSLGSNLRLEGASLIEAGATFDGDGNLVNLGGSVMNGEHTAAVGVLLENRGRLEPGATTGQVGNFGVAGYTHTTAATLAVEMQGDNGVPGEDYDRLEVRGMARLAGGILEATLLGGFIPVPGTMFTVLTTTDGLIGTFDALDLPGLNDDANWHIEYTPNDVVLEVLWSADFDKDGDVDGEDFLIWQENFGTGVGATQCSGDADNDGDVDGQDFLAWQGQLGNGGGGGGMAGTTAIPEPTSAAIGVVIAMLLVGRTRRST